MRSVFPAHFRPTPEELSSLWKDSIFAVDANVLLNLYRYSTETRRELETALESIKEKLFVPHQAAREFLKNRLTVTAAQADEYTKAVKTITDLAATLQNKKKHPFLPEAKLPTFKQQVEEVVKLLEHQREVLLTRMTKDEVLEFIQSISDQRTGPPFSEETLTELAAEGEKRYAAEIPPGYKDGKKDASGDPYRRFGDLIVWRQLIAKAKSESKSLIFVTDDKKEDWWIEQSGRTIGPRTELREEFLAAVSKDFWMYTVDLFIEESAKLSRKPVSAKVLEEIRTVREEVQAARYRDDTRYTYQAITPEQMLKRIQDSERWALTNAEGFVALQPFVKGHLGTAGFDYSASFDAIRQLEEEGLVEIYEHQGAGHARPVRSIRTIRTPEYKNRPLEELSDMLKSSSPTPPPVADA
jgi:hypothetical protein